MFILILLSFKFICLVFVHLLTRRSVKLSGYTDFGYIYFSFLTRWHMGGAQRCWGVRRACHAFPRGVPEPPSKPSCFIFYIFKFYSWFVKVVNKNVTVGPLTSDLILRALFTRDGVRFTATQDCSFYHNPLLNTSTSVCLEIISVKQTCWIESIQGKELMHDW